MLFVCRRHSGYLVDSIRRRGYEVCVLPTSEYHNLSVANPTHAGSLGMRWNKDVGQIPAVLADLAFDWLVVDHYALDARWEWGMRSHAAHILVNDDLAGRMTVACCSTRTWGCALDYAVRAPDRCALLIGLVFALLRAELAQVREYSLVRTQQPTLTHLRVMMEHRQGQPFEVLDAL
jgi:UDP-2,4-diacetamido-2,4,6-trideoxy-beta-L-altropyranose hydrolase